jgi:hypothetical protein
MYSTNKLRARISCHLGMGARLAAVEGSDHLKKIKIKFIRQSQCAAVVWCWGSLNQLAFEKKLLGLGLCTKILGIDISSDDGPRNYK